jgi:sensor c-di-GMP phosphodiesterase-like protein
MNDNSNEFYDVKISQDIINEKERNVITNTLIKNEEMRSNSIHSDSKQSDSKHWYNNKCFFVSALIVISAACIYMFIIFL